MHYQITEDDLPAFVAYLALGTLEAIRAGTVSPDIGIWTLGAPITWEPLEDAKLVPQEIIDVLRQGDELSALQNLAPQTFDAVVTDLIEQLHIALREMPNPNWRVVWSQTARDEDKGGVSDARQRGR